MARRGPDTLAFGPMRPVGLVNPRDGKRPYACVQLRQDDAEGRLFNLVGFQTKMTYAEQRRVFRMIPGLEQAEFVRLGSLHRNTFINSPAVLLPSLQVIGRKRLLLAGQLVGVEGYVESAATGLLAGLNAERLLQGVAPLSPPVTITVLTAGGTARTDSASPSSTSPTEAAPSIAGSCVATSAPSVPVSLHGLSPLYLRRSLAGTCARRVVEV